MVKEDIRSYEVVRIMMRSLFDLQLFRLRFSSARGGGILGILGGGVQPGSPNPDPTSDQKM